MGRAFVILTLIVFVVPSPARAENEWQVRPFVGLTFAGSTVPKYVDLEDAAGKANAVYGVSAALLGDVFGVEVDVARAPGFFESGGQNLVANSSATTFTGNVSIGPSREVTKYTLRPYFVGGFGLMHASTTDSLSALPVVLRR